eukprot:COSAG02_NODE_956_length_15670_cov_5.265750_5_plen_122_part_00
MQATTTLTPPAARARRSTPATKYYASTCRYSIISRAAYRSGTRYECAATFPSSLTGTWRSVLNLSAPGAGGSPPEGPPNASAGAAVMMRQPALFGTVLLACTAQRGAQAAVATNALFSDNM